MDEQEYGRKYMNLRILKSVQDYLKPGNTAATAVYPISVPDELLYQTTKFEGAEKCDSLIHRIFKLGLAAWSEELYQEVFGSEKELEKFIELVKNRNK